VAEVVAATVSALGSGATVSLEDPTGQFARNYNRETFMFAHGLATNPIFELKSLVELSRRMPDHRDTYWSNGRVGVEHGWNAGTGGRLTLQDTIAHIAENDSIVILKHTEQDPVFGPVLQDFLQRVVEFSGEAMHSDVTVGETLILISSPHRITPYHMDGETNFLVQVRGDKWFYVFDHDDRTLVSAEETERYYCGDINAVAYRAERQRDAVAYDLHAGYGVHVPVASPHWVQNKDNVSVAISVTYELRSVSNLIRVHKINRRLRQLGLRPAAPGMSPWRDRLKMAVAAGLAGVRSITAKKPLPRPYAAWVPRSRERENCS
jgi:hypothetical protein